MRSTSANHSIFAISAGSRESAINTEQTIDLTLLSDVGDVVNVVPRREDNRDEANGLEEPDTVYDLGYTAETTRNHSKAQPQHFGYLFAYGLGQCSTVAAGSGYLHTITPIQGGLDKYRELPSLTGLTRYGKTIAKRLLASMFVDQVTATFARDSWVKVSGTLKGTGKHTDSVEEETISAAANATTLTLAANGVEGATAAERLDNVQRIRVELTSGVWTEVDYTAVSDATPAEITITAPSEDTDSVSYKVLYIPTEAASFEFPSRVIESPMRMSELTFTMGGAWNGTTFVGGRDMSAELTTLTCSLANNSTISFIPGTRDYAGMHERGDRVQSVKVDRKMLDFIFQQEIKNNTTFGARALCVGSEYETGHNYQAEIIYPKLGILSSPISVNGKKLAEAGDFVALEDATYGSVIVRVKNLLSGFAQ